MKSLSIVFACEGLPLQPSGGGKMIFEYANRLVNRGHDVTLAFNCSWMGKTHFGWLPDDVRLTLFKGIMHFCPRWFHLSPKVRKISCDGFTDTEMPDADIVIATIIKTAVPVSKLKKEKGAKVYFIQGYENWGGITDAEVDASYRLGMKNIVIAKWLQKKVFLAGENSVLIPNGLDMEVFNIDIAPVERPSHSLSMMYAENDIKGGQYGIAAIKKLLISYPDLKVKVFGVSKRPVQLPDEVVYIRNATQAQLRKIYNESAVYMYPSVKEGFGLTGCEAMACGCTYICSDYGGQREYAEDGRNCLLSKPRDANGLALNVAKVFDNQHLRLELANNGYQDMQRLDWNSSVSKFEQVLLDWMKGE